ncbi:2'-5' RNA ligase family protein [Dyadobacter helix]|nr:2'-5' RNA ligase family protein [Dyadobacter sp. CECT 9275]
MASIQEGQIDLFGGTAARCEYYPVLIPDEGTLREIHALNEVLVTQLGLKPSQLVKMPHISIDGIICPENDLKVTASITEFLLQQSPLSVSFSEVGYFPGRGGVTVKLGIRNPDPILAFNRQFMTAVQGKITKLNLHLTLARYVNRELFDLMNQHNIIYPKSCICRSVAILKKRDKEKGPYVNIGTVDFGL